MPQELKHRKCRIAIVEDLPDIKEYLALLISSSNDFELITAYSNTEEAINFMPQLDIDIAVIDIGLPGLSGIQCVKKLSNVMLDTQFMMYTIFEEDEKVFDSLKAGASGYLLKSSSDRKFIRSLEELQEGGSPMSPLVARKVTDYFSNRNTVKKISSLSDRESELLNFLAQGLLYKEIAGSMGIKTGTVKQHINHIYKKLHVQNRTEATNFYFGRG